MLTLILQQLKGPAHFEEQLRVDEGISLGSNTYGSAGDVLTSGGGSSSVNTWTTPTIGTVTSVTAGTGITIGGTAADPTVGIDIVGTDNAVEVLTAATPASGDLVWFSDINDSNTLRKCTVADLQGPIGGPFLPLAGGTMAGAINMGTNNITNGGTATFTTFSGDLSGTINTATTAATQTQGDNSTKVATTAYVDAAIGNSTLAEVLANGNTTGATNIVVQKSIQLPVTGTNTGTPTDLGVISFGGTYTNGNRIFNDASGGTFRIQGSSNLQLFAPNFLVSNSNGNLISAGDTGAKLYYQGSEKLATTTNGVTITDDLTVDAGASSTINIYKDDAGNGKLSFYNDATQQVYLLHDTGENFYIHGGSGTQILMSSDNATTLTLKTGQAAQLNAYGSGTKTGTAAYNLEVDSSGNIIETPATNPGGKSGTFYKEYTTGTVAAGAATAFTLTRATSGTLVFTVYLTATLATDKQVAKMYQVAHTYGQTPVYNKVIDTGPLGADITVAFADSSNTAVTCSIAAVTEDSQPVGITVIVGHGATAVTFA